jgi:hypothetical protein
MNEGRFAAWAARIAPKSESAETTIRSSSDAVAREQHEEGQPAAAAMRCRLGISSWMREGHFPFHGRSCGEAQALTDIFLLKIRVFGQNFMLCHPACEQSQHGSDRNP